MLQDQVSWKFLSFERKSWMCKCNKR
jgi:hypothetical protein